MNEIKMELKELGGAISDTLDIIYEEKAGFYLLAFPIQGENEKNFYPSSCSNLPRDNLISVLEVVLDYMKNEKKFTGGEGCQKLH